VRFTAKDNKRAKEAPARENIWKKKAVLITTIYLTRRWFSVLRKLGYAFSLGVAGEMLLVFRATVTSKKFVGRDPEKQNACRRSGVFYL